jgi:hypothetical protein
MLTKFWEGIGDKLADKWVTQLLAPALVFWVGGLLAWATRFGWAILDQWFTQLSETEQLAVLVGGLLLIGASSAVVETFVLPVLRLLEGYWPHWVPIRGWLVSWQNLWLNRAECRWQELANRGIARLTSMEREEYVALDQQIRLAPADRTERMPTQLGNILRAAERRPGIKYGLDAIVCWPRLWLLLPDGAKAELSAARSTLDTAVRIAIWSMLFLVWGIWEWWALAAGLFAAFFAYRQALSAAQAYGDLLEAAFDLHRMKLYKELRWQAPDGTENERARGEKVTEYLFRGTLSHPEKYTEDKESK